MGARRRGYHRNPKHRHDLLALTEVDSEVPHLVNGDRLHMVQQGCWYDKYPDSRRRERRENRRFLESNVGSVWNDVWSEVCEKYKKKKNRHRREDIREDVAVQGLSRWHTFKVDDNGILQKTSKEERIWRSARYAVRAGRSIIDLETFIDLFIVLVETRHKDLNRILKLMRYTIRPCNQDDPCTSKRERVKYSYFLLTKNGEAFLPNDWMARFRHKLNGYRKRLTPWEWEELREQGFGNFMFRERQVVMEDVHDLDRCPNRAVVTMYTDASTVARAVWQQTTGHRFHTHSNEYRQRLFRDLLDMMGWRY